MATSWHYDMFRCSFQACLKIKIKMLTLFCSSSNNTTSRLNCLLFWRRSQLSAQRFTHIGCSIFWRNLLLGASYKFFGYLSFKINWSLFWFKDWLSCPTQSLRKSTSTFLFILLYAIQLFFMCLRPQNLLCFHLYWALGVSGLFCSRRNSFSYF